MSVLARSVASTPKRTASETWEVIVALLAPDKNSPARKELEAARGVACASIASEALFEDAFIGSGSGPQVRVYCVYDDDAISGDGTNEAPFVQSPTAGDWSLSIPCPTDDLAWSNKKLKSDCTRVTARAVGEGIEEKKQSKSSASATASSSMRINVEEFLKS